MEEAPGRARSACRREDITKGFDVKKVKQADGTIKVVVERNWFYGRGTPARIAMRNSTTERAVSPGVAGLKTERGRRG